MLCKSITEQELIKGDWQQYIAENKLDGTRCMLIKQGIKINLISRSSNDYTEKYPEIVNEAKDLPDCIIDGELTFYDNNGKDVFLTSLATAETIKEYGVKAILMVFDILQFNGVDVKKEPLLKRKEYLKGMINPCWNNIKLLKWHDDSVKLWELIKAQDREGIVLKNKHSLYTPNYRSKMWLKVKVQKSMDLSIMGFTSNKREISALVTNKGKVNFNLKQNDYNYWKGIFEQNITGKDKDVILITPKFKCEVLYHKECENGLRFPILKRVSEK